MPSPDHGRFCWYDLMSTRPEESLDFYGELLGWSIENVPMGEMSYDMIHAGKTPIGGIVPLDPEQQIPSHWMPYVAVDDIAASCEVVARVGGGVCVPPTDIGPGVFAVINDPQGGFLSIWQSKEPLGPAPAKGTPHVFCWNECMSSDAAAAAGFYEAVFGWRVEKLEMILGGDSTTYYLLYHNDEHHAGIMDMPPPAIEQGAGSHWLSYVNVPDVDKSSEQAASLGATMLCPCTDIPDTGRFCVIQDPQGGMVSLFTDKK